MVVAEFGPTVKSAFDWCALSEPAPFCASRFWWTCRVVGWADGHCAPLSLNVMITLFPLVVIPFTVTWSTEEQCADSDDVAEAVADFDPAGLVVCEEPAAPAEGAKRSARLTPSAPHTR